MAPQSASLAPTRSSSGHVTFRQMAQQPRLLKWLLQEKVNIMRISLAVLKRRMKPEDNTIVEDSIWEFTAWMAAANENAYRLSLSWCESSLELGVPR
jgi:hypothetical protein